MLAIRMDRVFPSMNKQRLLLDSLPLLTINVSVDPKSFDAVCYNG